MPTMKRVILSISLAAFAVAVQAGETKTDKEASGCCSSMKATSTQTSGGCCMSQKAACTKGKETAAAKPVLVSPKARG